MKKRVDTSLRMVFSSNVKQRRKDKGWTQIQLAAHSELSQVFVSRIELGKVAATIDTIQELAAALDCEPGELLAPSPDIPPAENPETGGV